MTRAEWTKGFFVSFAFGDGALTEIDRFFRQTGKIIIPLTVGAPPVGLCGDGLSATRSATRTPCHAVCHAEIDALRRSVTGWDGSPR